MAWDQNRWLIQSAWQAAVAVTARAYRLQARALAEPGRGRGPQRPPIYWEARKVALYVTVLSADCSFAALARTIGMHRDTVTGQCAQVRELVITDPMLARRVNVLEEHTRDRIRPERLAALEGMAAMVEGWCDRGLVDSPQEAEHYRTLVARARETATQARGIPTGFGAANRGHGNVIEPFPGGTE